ncbi:MAG: amidohydrolase [Chloroflexi bacterium]|nr:amidohydrolase [Chloroflexota bacterium]
MPTLADLKRATLAAIDQRKAEVIGIARAVLENPETGFTEQKTSRLVQETLRAWGVPFQAGLALTGVKGAVQGKAGPGPAVAIIGELDSLRVPDHPHHDEATGAAHACGHHCQVASMLGALAGLLTPSVLESLSGRIVPFAVPAEEFIEVERRLRLREEGRLEFMGGKQELLRLGAFDDVDMAMLCHTSTDRVKLAVGGTSNGHVVKFVQYSGKGAHAGGSPHLGINALNAAAFALSAINAIRETFREQDTVRVHGILTRGGEAVSAVPSRVTLEWRVRSGNLEALVDNSQRVDRCFKAGALAVGASVTITNIPGYLPLLNAPLLQETFLQNAVALVGRGAVAVRPPEHNGGGSTDMGDLSQVMPVIHPYCGGAQGTAHGNDYLIRDYETAVVVPAKAMAMTVIDLLAEGATRARQVLSNSRPPMSMEQYVAFQRARAEVVRYDGAKG